MRTSFQQNCRLSTAFNFIYINFLGYSAVLFAYSGTLQMVFAALMPGLNKR